jgi:hypothetical protein
MAVRARLYHPDEVKAKIKTSQIINRLNGYALGELQMEKAQVTAALGLLKKTVPDLQSIEATLQGPGGSPIQISSSDSEL